MTEVDTEHRTSLYAEALLKVDDPVRFGFCDDGLIVEHLGRGLKRTLPLAAVPILTRFANWTPASHAFSDPDQDLEFVFALVRYLVATGFLIVRGTEGSTNPVHRDRWKVWGTALLYHLESRSTTDATYLTSEESTDLLAEKARHYPTPACFKDYPGNPFYPLPDPTLQGAHPMFLDVVMRRRTCRSFSNAAVTSAQLSALLFFTWGFVASWLRRPGDQKILMKTSPSGGSRHSVEVYPILLNISDLPCGTYHYSVRNHGLEMLSSEDPRPWLVKGCGDQTWVNDCAAVFVMAAVLERMAWKYTVPRAYRVLLFDVGHLSQTFALVATSLALGSFATAALRDEIFEQKLGLDHLEEPVFLVTGAGNPAAEF